jgi:hypothetical protein
MYRPFEASLQSVFSGAVDAAYANRVLRDHISGHSNVIRVVKVYENLTDGAILVAERPEGVVDFFDHLRGRLSVYALLVCVCVCVCVCVFFCSFACAWYFSFLSLRPLLCLVASSSSPASSFSDRQSRVTRGFTCVHLCTYAHPIVVASEMQTMDHSERKRCARLRSS